MPCDLNPTQCQNGATCANDNKGGYACTCENGYTGTDCENGKDLRVLLAGNYGKNWIFEVPKKLDSYDLATKLGQNFFGTSKSNSIKIFLAKTFVFPLFFFIKKLFK